MTLFFQNVKIKRNTNFGFLLELSAILWYCIEQLIIYWYLFYE